MNEQLTRKPEQVRAEYNGAYHFKHVGDKLALEHTPITEEDEVAQREMVFRGNYSLDSAVRNAQHYARDHGEALQEQARFEMETKKDIDSLPVSNGPNN